MQNCITPERINPGLLNRNYGTDIQGAVYGGVVPECGPRYPTIAAKSLVEI